MKRFGLNPQRLHRIFISHLHGDHVFGLFGLLSTLGLMGRKKEIHLFGPEDLGPMMQAHFRFFGRLPFELVFHVPGSGSGELCFEDEKVNVYSFPLEHRTPTFGYLFREKLKPLNVRKDKIAEYGLGLTDILKLKRGEDISRPDGEILPYGELTLPPFRPRSYAYLSDTRYIPGLAPILKGVDLLFHEATFSAEDTSLAGQTMHSTSVEAAKLARDAGAGKLLIGHFSNRYKDHGQLEREAREIFPSTFGVNDGDRYSIPLMRTPLK